jgi:hypothetical protein
MTLTTQGLSFGECPRTDAKARNGSTITLSLSAYQGWVWADKVVEFCPSALYQSRRPKSSRDPDALLSEVRSAMKDLPKFYVYGLSDDPALKDRSGRMRDQRGELVDTFTVQLRRETIDWQHFQQATKTWLLTMPQQYQGQPAIVVSGNSATFSNLFVRYIESLKQKLAGSALYFIDIKENKFIHSAVNQGHLVVNVVDPIGDWKPPVSANRWCVRTSLKR